MPNVFAATPVKNVLPSSINTSITNYFTIVDKFRSNTHKEITSIRIDTQKDIDRLITNKTLKRNLPEKPLDKTELPIAYIKLFLISIISFIFSTVVTFYVICAVLIFLVLRYLYRKIRNR